MTMCGWRCQSSRDESDVKVANVLLALNIFPQLNDMEQLGPATIT